jgi:hypothetical protein
MIKLDAILDEPKYCCTRSFNVLTDKSFRTDRSYFICLSRRFSLKVVITVTRFSPLRTILHPLGISNSNSKAISIANFYRIRSSLFQIIENVLPLLLLSVKIKSPSRAFASILLKGKPKPRPLTFNFFFSPRKNLSNT